MKRKIVALGLSAMLLATLVLAGCPPINDVIEVVDPVPVLFPRHETLHVETVTGAVGAPQNFNFWGGGGGRVDHGFQNLVFQSLWTIDYLHKGGVVHNSLAAAPAVFNEDFTHLTIKLREGVYWSDGVEFTADDVVFTIEYVRSTLGLGWHWQMLEVEKVYAADRFTVHIELYEPNARFNTFFTDRWGAFRIMPKHVFSQFVTEWDPKAVDLDAHMAFEFNPPVTIGQYVLHSYDPLGFWTAWERRDDYNRTAVYQLFGKPAPRYVIFHQVGDPAAQIMAMAAGELDVALALTVEARDAVKIMDPYARSFFPDFPWAVNKDPFIAGVWLNPLIEPLDCRYVRWALVLAMDICGLAAVAFDSAVRMSPLHIPCAPLENLHFHLPMEEWLKDFTLYLGDGEYFHPYDPEASIRVAEFARTVRGHAVPECPEEIRKLMGIGWWHYAPDVAARLLERRGLSRCPEGWWLLPDGTRWSFVIQTLSPPGHPFFQVPMAMVHEWREFGIDATLSTCRAYWAATIGVGEWAARSGIACTWGGHHCLVRVFRHYDLEHLAPIGEPGHRWADPRLCAARLELLRTDWVDYERIAELGREGLKVLVEEMPAIPVFNYMGQQVVSHRYWTGWPCSENPYMLFFIHWANFKYMLPFLESVER